ncbi:phospholipase D-like domain-containing protein [Paenibacillus puerhi]|uniref:phospholipase D-like domain-containing protein n=1 Tax=Paenibacillus puerhi TaxID=2692622 RepID=UPI00135A017B|nr:phospholipase D-like domain-containing protein [Paenibacillus puerhi]
MNDIFFDNFKNVIKKELQKSEIKVRVAVAWINFEIYFDIFRDILERKVKLEVVINSDVLHQRYHEKIKELEKLGMVLKRLKMPGGKQYMHHKFCVIDDSAALVGSYNWTINASNNNFENLLLTPSR